MIRAVLVSISVLTLAACSEEATTDAGSIDASSADGAVDAGTRSDATVVPDASSVDATSGDGGGASDSGVGGRSWSGTTTCGGTAWAVGALRKVSVAELAGATFDADDVVWVSDGAPTALPAAGAIVVGAGSASEMLFTAAEAAHVPLIEWTGDGGALDALLGRELIVLTRKIDWLGPDGHTCEARLDDVTGYLDAEARTEIADARAHPGVARTRTLLLPRPVDLCTAAMEGTSVHAVHRNTPHLSLVPKRMWLTDGLTESPHDTFDFTHRIGDRVIRDSGALASLPGAHVTHDMYAVKDEWTADEASGTHRLGLEIPTYEWVGTALPAGIPIVVYDHLGANFTIQYPGTFMDPGSFGPTMGETVALWPCSVFSRIEPRRRTITVPSLGTLVYDLVIGGPAGRTYFTSPISRVVSTTLTGLLATPLTLQAEDAQSASADHHNFSERLILEPGRDPSVPTATLEMLEAMDIRALYFEIDLNLSVPNTATAVWARGADGTWRALL